MANANPAKLYIVVIIIVIVDEKQKSKNILILVFNISNIKDSFFFFGLI